MNKIARVLGTIEFLNRIFYLSAAIILFLLFVLMTSDVLGRFLFNSPITGSNEISLYLIVAVAFLGMGYAQITGKHVCIDLVTAYFPKQVRNVSNIILLLLSAAFFAIMTKETGTVAYKDFVGKVFMSFTTIKPPLWVISFIASVGCALLVISLLLQVTRKIHELRKQDKTTE